MVASTLNFPPHELTCSCCGGHGMQQWALDKHQQIRDDVGEPLIVRSAWRCAKHPVEVRKTKPGTHFKGTALDFKATSGTFKGRIVVAALKAGARGIGIGKDFVHVDFDPDRQAVTFWGYY